MLLLLVLVINTLLLFCEYLLSLRLNRVEHWHQYLCLKSDILSSLAIICWQAVHIYDLFKAFSCGCVVFESCSFFDPNKPFLPLQPDPLMNIFVLLEILNSNPAYSHTNVCKMFLIVGYWLMQGGASIAAANN